MSLTITVKNYVNGSTVRMQTEADETIADIIDSAAEYWKKEPKAYVLKKGKTMLRATSTVAEAGILSGDILDMIPDPEGGSA